MSEVQTALNSVISRVHKTTQIAQPPTLKTGLCCKNHSIRQISKVWLF